MLRVEQGILPVLETCNCYVCADLPACAQSQCLSQQWDASTLFLWQMLMCLHMFGYLYVCFCSGVLGLESLKSLALSVVAAQNQHVEGVVDWGPGCAEPVVRLSPLLWQPCSLCFGF